ncbi:MAG: autotransporter domain-containing protein [Proteobacteria bacterium]|nr:autotransporter domain-containing protein [Pseudomonadota bacterium]
MTKTAPQAAQQKQRLHGTALSTLRSRLRIGTALAGMVLPLGIPGLALAADECGAPLGGVVTCTAAGNPYAGGITYGGTNFTVNLSADAEVRTSAAGVNAVQATSSSGAIQVDNIGVISTAGQSSIGIMASSPGGDVTVTNGGTIATTGEGAFGINAESTSGKVTVTNGGSVTTEGVRAHAIWAQNDQGDVVVNNSGNISTTGEDAAAIQASATGGDVTVISTGTVSTVDGTAIFAGTNGTGQVLVDVSSVTAGGGGRGINVSSVDGDIHVKVGSATTTSEEGPTVDMSSSNGDLTLEAGTLTTFGGASSGVYAYADTGTIDLTANSIVTHGDDSYGINASTNSGPIAIDVGSVTTTGDWAGGINARSTTGAVTVDARGAISTAGSESRGIMTSSSSGDVTVTNSGTVATTGDDTVGIGAESVSGKITVTNSGSVTTAGERSDAIWAQNDQGDIVIGNTGTVGTTGAASDAIYASTNTGNVTVTSTGTVTAVDGTGVLAQSTSGNIVLDVASATGGGLWNRAVYGLSATGNVTARVGTASTTGEAYVVDLRSVGGDISLVAGDVSSEGSGAIGVFATSDTGRVELEVNSVSTVGDDSNGVNATTVSGAIAIDIAGPITTQGDRSSAIFAESQTGAVSVDARGPISTSGLWASGIEVSTDNDVTITAGNISTAGRGGDGISASSGNGKLTVVANGTITTKGKSAKGIGVSSDSGDIDVTAGNIDTARDDAHGIEANSNTGKVKIVSNGAIAVRGENAHGIKAESAGSIDVTANSVSVSGYRADGVVLSSDTGIELALRDLRVTGDGSDGIIAHTTSGPVRIDVGNVHASDGRAISAETRNGDTSVRIAGKVRGQAEEIVYAGSTGVTRIDILADGEVSSISGTSTAIFAAGTNVLIDNAGLISATSVPTLITSLDSTTNLANSGTFIGSLIFGEGGDLITNSGTFKLSGNSDFSDGDDRFMNSGIVNLLASATLQDLELFENSGLVTMANNSAGEVLTITGDYVGTNGRLALDIDTASAVMRSDMLVIGGSASGTTTLVLNSVRGGAMLPGQTLTLVDAAGGTAAGAFTLSPDTVNAGFARYALNYDALGDDFYLSASEGLGLFQMLKVNEGAQALWRQSADAWSARMASLRDPAKNGVEQGPVWFQFYSSADERDQVYAANSGDYDLSYRQKHVGGQVGADLGTLGGITYGLTGGYLASALKFAGSNDRTDYDALNLGAYAQGQWGNYFVNGLAKYDLFQAKIDSVTGGFTEKLDGRAYGLQLEAGARFGNDGFFLEPVASLAYSRTDLDTLEVLGAAVDFDAANSLRGKIGARIGGTTPVGAGVATFYLGAHLVNEFEGKDGVRFVNGGATSVLANDPVGAYGQFQLGATLVSETGLNGFVEGTASVGNDYQNYGGRLGVRMAF